jgi:predicted aspartyl protease
VIGKVDGQLRALVPIRVGQPQAGNTTEIPAWVDTAFNGALVQLETYGCSVEWFGRTYDTQVVPNDGEFALLGTMLLAGRRVEIDYSVGTVSIE